LLEPNINVIGSWIGWNLRLEAYTHSRCLKPYTRSLECYSRCLKPYSHSHSHRCLHLTHWVH
jgi:hypothetical protein